MSSVSARITLAGQQLLAKIIAASTSLQITRVAVGDGEPATVTPTALVHYVKDINLSGVVRAGSNATIQAQVISGDTELYISEIGIYAQDPDDGEILMGYLGLDVPDYVYANGGGVLSAKEYDMAIVVGQVPSIVANIAVSSFCTIGQLNAVAARFAGVVRKVYSSPVTVPTSAWVSNAAQLRYEADVSCSHIHANSLVDITIADAQKDTINLNALNPVAGKVTLLTPILPKTALELDMIVYEVMTA